MYIALVDCICMEDVWHANLTCQGPPHVPGNISSYDYVLHVTDTAKSLTIQTSHFILSTEMPYYQYLQF